MIPSQSVFMSLATKALFIIWNIWNIFLILVNFSHAQRLAIFVAVVHVLAEGSGMAETLAALLTLEWLFSAVQPFMLS